MNDYIVAQDALQQRIASNVKIVMRGGGVTNQKNVASDETRLKRRRYRNRYSNTDPQRLRLQEQ